MRLWERKSAAKQKSTAENSQSSESNEKTRRTPTMTKIRVMDRDLKANFEVRVTNKETNKSRSFNMHAEEVNEEEIRDRIKEDMLAWEKEE